MSYHTPKRQLSKESANRLFTYVGGVLFWKTSTSQKIKVGAPAGSLDSSSGYWRVMCRNKSYKTHNIVWNMHYGEISDGLSVDHINRVRHDNNIENLRLVTPSQQKTNQGTYKNNTSGYRGVGWHKKSKKWVARAQVNYETVSLGYFDTPLAAASALANHTKGGNDD
jgi:hypothetical protein